VLEKVRRGCPHAAAHREQLSSLEADDRFRALQGVQALVVDSDESTRRTLQAHAVVAKLIERLADDKVDCQVEAVSALRCLAVEGGPEICAEVSSPDR